ncbi:hypothetical protein BDY19DRAFT_993203 [Irpex rosettiformis]|uniref:Uncharacterized protein n=1 Tax=Irpex rosettiformis TaxID=378272 RepID=A0ACB8U5S9_9APHY|nr:hypothetical protein BDY19DRAFT_993203 [Irpex rosettiformis]
MSAMHRKGCTLRGSPQLGRFREEDINVNAGWLLELSTARFITMRFAFAYLCCVVLALVAVEATPVPEPRAKAAAIHSRIDAQILTPPPVTRAFNDAEVDGPQYRSDAQILKPAEARQLLHNDAQILSPVEARQLRSDAQLLSPQV